MFPAKEKKNAAGSNGLVAVAVDKDKGSQNAMKWALDNILTKGQTVLLIHVKTKNLGNGQVLDEQGNKPLDPQSKEVLLPFRCFCMRKDVQCREIVLEDQDVVKATTEYACRNAIEKLVVGASSKGGFLRFKDKDTPGSISKAAPDFCTVYVISKGKVQSMRSASRAAPPSLLQLQIVDQVIAKTDPINKQLPPAVGPKGPASGAPKFPMESSRNASDQTDTFRSPFTRKGYNEKFGELSMRDCDISYVCTGRRSTERMLPLLYDSMDGGAARISNASAPDFNGYESPYVECESIDISSPNRFSSDSQESDRSVSAVDDLEAEMRRLKNELRQTMAMYSTACKEAMTAKQKEEFNLYIVSLLHFQALELQRWKMEEEKKLEEVRLSEEATMAIIEREKAKSRAAIEHAEAARRLAEMEAKKRIDAEAKALKEAEEKRKVLDALTQTDVRYRKYTIEEIEAATEFFAQSRKIGEGGYGPVYKCYLDHTPVAIKVLRPDAAQGRSQFQQEVEILSCIRHPNMVLLLGACPEYGCLVYEYMENGSLEDRLLRRGDSPPLSWQLRFRIAAEIGTSLLFLHQTKPEPLVHRDLKPGNILLDRNFVSKISDVGLARLVPPSVADNVTQYRMTSTAGTFCYIDPEYQQTGMLGIKSDVYSLGIMFLQIITAKPAMGLSHHAGRAIEKGTFADLLDPSVLDWPVEEALSFAKLALKCAELRRKDRPDLGKVVLPELNKWRKLAEDSMQHPALCHSAKLPPDSPPEEMIDELPKSGSTP